MTLDGQMFLEDPHSEYLLLFLTEALQLLTLCIEGPSLEHLTKPVLVLLQKDVLDDFACG